MSQESRMCDSCGKSYKFNIYLPTDVWSVIAYGERYLCPECIGKRINENFSYGYLTVDEFETELDTFSYDNFSPPHFKFFYSQCDEKFFVYPQDLDIPAFITYSIDKIKPTSCDYIQSIHPSIDRNFTVEIIQCTS